MVDDIIDLMFEDETIKDRFVNPVKKKAYPILLGGIFFNLVVLILLTLIIIKLNKLGSATVII